MSGREGERESVYVKERRKEGETERVKKVMFIYTLKGNMCNQRKEMISSYTNIHVRIKCRHACT